MIFTIASWREGGRGRGERGREEREEREGGGGGSEGREGRGRETEESIPFYCVHETIVLLLVRISPRYSLCILPYYWPYLCPQYSESDNTLIVLFLGLLCCQLQPTNQINLAPPLQLATLTIEENTIFYHDVKCCKTIDTRTP